MTDLHWNPINCKSLLTSFGRNSSVYVHLNRDGTFVFIWEGTLTSLLVLSVKDLKYTGTQGNLRLKVELIESKNEIISIDGNDKYIFMFDKCNNLYTLKRSINNVLENFDALNINEYLDIPGNFSWQRKKHLPNCFAVTAFTGGLAVLHHSQSLYIAVARSSELHDVAFEFSSKKLCYFDPGAKYFMTKLVKITDSNIFKKYFNSSPPDNEIILVLMASQFLIINPTPMGVFQTQSHSVSLQDEYVVDVLEFPCNNCIMIVCKSGKIISLIFGFDSIVPQISYAWLPSNVFTVVGYEGEDELVLLWSDLNNICMSRKNVNTEVIHNRISNSNILGVRHLIKINNKILAVTRNACLYYMDIDAKCKKSLGDLKLSSDDILKTIFNTSQRMEELIAEITQTESLVMVVEMSRSSGMSKSVLFTVKKDTIIIENKTDHLFKKEMWMIRLEFCSESHQRHVEIKRFDTDLTPFGCVTIPYSGAQIGTVNVGLMCDCVADYVNFFDLSSDAIDACSMSEPVELTNFKRFLTQRL